MTKTSFAFTAALFAASASFAQVNLDAGAQAGSANGATVTLPAPATDKATATTGVGTGARVELPAPAAENGAKTEAGAKADAGLKTEATGDAETKKTSAKSKKKSTTELGAGAAAKGGKAGTSEK